jgi:glycosyltransferase involved in cell wall biosynthesis
VTSITVVLTTHDRAELADRALASIRAQSRPVDRVIVVDDASREPYRPQGDDVTVIRCPVNVGVCVARNRALSLADTDLVAFLDDDDWLGPDFVCEQLRGLAGTTLPGPVAALGTRVFVRSDRSERRETARAYVKGDDWMADPSSTTENSLVAPVQALRDIGGFDPELASWEHVDLLQRLAKVCSIERNPSAEYFSPDDDGIPRLSSSWAKVADAIELTMAKHGREIRRDRHVHARYLRAAAANRIMAGQRRRGLQLAWRALWALPDRRSAKTVAQALVGPRLFAGAQQVARHRRSTGRAGAPPAAAR